MRTPPVTVVAYIPAIIGAPNWGLIGAFAFDLVAAIFGPMSAISRIIDVLVGIAGIWLIFAGFTYFNRGDVVRTDTTRPVR